VLDLGGKKWRRFKALKEGNNEVDGSENTLWWPKNVVANIVFQNHVTFNFHQANFKRGFHKLYSK
jgi:hypothetical protein